MSLLLQLPLFRNLSSGVKTGGSSLGGLASLAGINIR